MSSFGILEAPARQVAALETLAHRPWPLPETSWVMGQTWDDLLFAHWPVSASLVREHVPAHLAIDEHEGSAWIGVTPFAVTGLRARGLLPLPFLSTFVEVNVRTYVTQEDRPGIWFFSLDASSQLAVEAARRVYRLPYFQAHMSLERRGGRIVFECARHGGRAFSATYAPSGAAFEAVPGSLEHFLAERYCLYAEEKGRLFRCDIHHAPWSLQPATAAIDLNTLPPDWAAPSGSPTLHYSLRQDVVIWPLEQVAQTVT